MVAVGPRARWQHCGVRAAVSAAAVAVLAAMLVVTAPAPDAAAAGPFVVDTGLDAVDAAIDGVCATAAGDCTLRAAVQEANASGGLTPVTFDPSVAVVSLDLAGSGGAEEGDLDLTSGTTLRLTGNLVDASTTTRVQASALGDRHFEVASGARLELRYVSLSDAQTTGDGGAVLNHGELSVTTDADFEGSWTAFHDNTATGFGGAIASTASSQVELADRSTADAASSLRLEDNSAELGGGNISTVGATMTIEGSTGGADHDVFIDRGTTQGDGGGLLVVGGTVDLGCRSHVRDSSAARGGNIATGVAMLFSAIRLSGSSLAGGSATQDGGGVYLSPKGELDVLPGCGSAPSRISGSTAVDDGGAVMVDSGMMEVQPDAELEITGSGGRDARDGGALAARAASLIWIYGELNIDGTTAERDGGALHVSSDEPVAPSDISNIFSVDGRARIHRAAAGGNGGAVAISGPVYLVGDVDIDESSAGGDGGGWWVGDRAGVLVGGSAMTRNTATRGGAVAVVDGAREFTAFESTIAGNTAEVAGGAVWANNGRAILSGVTMVDNTPDGVHSDGSPSATIEWVLAARNGSASCVGDIQSVGFNVADEPSCLTNDTDLSDPDRFDDVEELLELQERGVYRPLPGHPAIDLAVCPDYREQDQLGAVRPVDGDGDGEAWCDAGSIEAAAVTLPPTTLPPTTVPPTTVPTTVPPTFPPTNSVPTTGPPVGGGPIGAVGNVGAVRGDSAQPRGLALTGSGALLPIAIGLVLALLGVVLLVGRRARPGFAASLRRG